MNAYDKGSDARHGPAGPGAPHSDAAPPGPVPAVRPPAPGTPPRDSAGPADRPPGARTPGTGPGQDGGSGAHPGAGPGSGPDTGSEAGPGPGAGPPAEPRTGVAALSLRYQLGAAVALAVVAVGVCAHLGLTFLHVAPLNTVSKQHRETIDSWIYPEFEQNWKLFAPNPLQQNIAVQVRAEIRTTDGSSRTTGWYDLSARDGRAIDGNPAPSHTQQNELRRAWDFFVSTHDSDDRPVGLRGALSEAYLRRITVMRLDRADAAGPDGVVARVQVRSRTANVPPPDWSDEKIPTTPAYRVLPWWSVPGDESRGGIG
ncbi:membrane protein [Streptomyces toyocaensis]|uniref:Membrane protein n=1 Tax=Streptomyces toyocaensis TaxID=55952 RepID=A0A081XLG5_STRTO|nr:DUF5819 family protein [Streptomyces toyocaensis]KES04388.1 membrane protein [Streptomyces toyocaensis]